MISRQPDLPLAFDDLPAAFPADHPLAPPAGLLHHPRRHAARHTQEYLYHQLIPYLGNKRKLLPLVAMAIQRSGVVGGRFFDAFAGSGVVSRLAKTLGFQVFSNDWEPYHTPINGTYIGLNRAPAFRALGGMEAAFRAINELPPLDGYIATHYCPRDDGAPDPDRERLFFTRANGRRIDAVREEIARLWGSGDLTPAERDVLLASLLFAVSYVANTSGVFKGFHRGWGGSSGTALYRIMSPLTLRPPIFFSNGRANRVLTEDATAVAGRLDCAIAYLDPPYNQHQYGSNYHLLNTLALWDKPPLNPSILVGGRQVDKSAIRRDWRTERRSAYCYRHSALPEFARLLDRLRADLVLVSYSSDGLIALPDLVHTLAARGSLSCVSQRYKRYRVSPTRPSQRPHNIEFVLILDRRGPARMDSSPVLRQLLETPGPSPCGDA